MRARRRRGPTPDGPAFLRVSARAGPGEARSSRPPPCRKRPWDANLLHQSFQNVLKRVWYSGPPRAGQARSAHGVGPDSQAGDCGGACRGCARSDGAAGRFLGAPGSRPERRCLRSRRHARRRFVARGADRARNTPRPPCANSRTLVRRGRVFRRLGARLGGFSGAPVPAPRTARLDRWCAPLSRCLRRRRPGAPGQGARRARGRKCQGRPHIGPPALPERRALALERSRLPGAGRHPLRDARQGRDRARHRRRGGRAARPRRSAHRARGAISELPRFFAARLWRRVPRRHSRDPLPCGRRPGPGRRAGRIGAARGSAGSARQRKGPAGTPLGGRAHRPRSFWNRRPGAPPARAAGARAGERRAPAHAGGRAPRPRTRRRGCRSRLASDAGRRRGSRRSRPALPGGARRARPRPLRGPGRLGGRGSRRAGGRPAVGAGPRAPRPALRRRRKRGRILPGRGVGGDRVESARAPRRARGPAVNFNLLWAGALADELALSGVRHAVICPGSRSGPLALALAGRFRAHTVVDERSAAFFALGAAKASGRPVAVLSTSGTAGAHFYPALLEAEASGVPVIAITADRPPELHGWGAPQQLDQHRLFGAHAWFAELGPPDPAGVPHLRATVARALQHGGPVHLNAPFREPLAPVPEPLPEVRDEPAARHFKARGQPDAREVSADLSQRPRGVIVCGPRDAQDDLPAAVRELSSALGYAVIADASSGVAEGVAHADLILRHERWAQTLRPQAVVRVGGGISSKVAQSWLEQAGRTIVVHERGEPIDPAHRATAILEADAPGICRALAAQARAQGPLGALFELAERRARGALETAFADAPWGESLIAREAALAAELLYVASSMPVRDVDALAPRRGRVLANRGLNGIDGIVSSAAGAAAVTGARALALVGDLALLHDLGGLVAAARLRLPLTAVCVNNDGGGIFHFLPIARHADRFEELFATPHGLDLEGAARLCRAEFMRVSDGRQLRAALQRSASGLRLLEARTDRAANVEQHRALQAAVVAALGDPP